MNRTKIFTCVCMLAVAAVMPGTARADAESTAARCVGKIQQTVDRSGFVVADRTTETVQLIIAFLTLGVSKRPLLQDVHAFRKHGRTYGWLLITSMM